MTTVLGNVRQFWQSAGLFRYIAKRLLLAIPVLIGTSLLIYSLVYALPGDPIRALAGDRPFTPEVMAQLRDGSISTIRSWCDTVSTSSGSYTATSAPTFSNALSHRLFRSACR